MINRFEYTIGAPAEDLEKYCRGGYHPIHLGDALHDGQYKIFHKLGFGSFSTVWLARDNRHQRNVALKVVTAKKSDESARELHVLQALRDRGDPNHPGRKHVLHLLDCFHIQGPNGRHVCLVLNVLGPSAFYIADRNQNCRLEGNLARSVSRQLLYAVDYLHSAGVVHGDIHTGNVLFRFRELEELAPEHAIKALGPPQLGKVQRRDGGQRPPGVPEYLVLPAEYSARTYLSLSEVQLVDFGESFFTTNPPESISSPVSLHPPELVFRRPLTSAVDIWNLGCTTYELVTGQIAFEARFQRDTILIPQFQELIGPIPDQWIRDAISSGLLEKPPDRSTTKDCFLLLEDIRHIYFDGYERRTLELDEATIEILGRYLWRLLVIDPEHRATSSVVLEDPWIHEETCLQPCSGARKTGQEGLRTTQPHSPH